MSRKTEGTGVGAEGENEGEKVNFWGETQGCGFVEKSVETVEKPFDSNKKQPAELW